MWATRFVSNSRIGSENDLATINVQIILPADGKDGNTNVHRFNLCNLLNAAFNEGDLPPPILALF